MVSNGRKGKEVKSLMEELTLDHFSLEDYIEGKNYEDISVEYLRTEKENLQISHEEQTYFNIKNYFINSIVYFNVYSEEINAFCEINSIDNITVNGVHYDKKSNIFRVFEIHKIYYGTEVVETGVCQVDPNSTPLLISDDEDDSNVSTEHEKESNVGDLGKLDKINYIETPRVNILFPTYNVPLLLGLVNYIGIRTLNYVLCKREKSCESVKIVDILRIFVPDTWLNDVIINCYVNLLVKQSNDKILFFNSFFFQGATNKGFTKYLGKTLNNIKLFTYSKIIIPTHLEIINHWTLIVVEPQAKLITYFDSFISLNNFDALSKKISFVVGFMNMVYRAQELYTPTSTWKIKCGNSPTQSNMNDCGVFVCTNARYAVFNKQINYDQEDINLIRQRITYEIVTNKILPTI